jgi:hypothetical protein
MKLHVHACMLLLASVVLLLNPVQYTTPVVGSVPEPIVAVQEEVVVPPPKKEENLLPFPIKLQTQQPQPLEFHKAKSAEVVPQPDGTVIVLAEELSKEKNYGVRVFTIPEVSYPVLYPVGGTDLPSSIKPWRFRNGENEFLIEGKPGQKFNITIWPDTKVPPEFIQVTIPGKAGPEDPTNPPTGYEDLIKLVKASILDKPTASNLSKMYGGVVDKFRSKLDAGEAVTIPEIQKAVQLAKIDTPKDGSQNWAKKFFDPLELYVVKMDIKDPSIYVEVLRTISESLKN